MEINRVWSMPNKHTFDIKPIKEIIENMLEAWKNQELKESFSKRIKEVMQDEEIRKKLSDSAKFCTKCGAETSRMTRMQVNQQASAQKVETHGSSQVVVQQTVKQMGQPDVYIHERFENWGMTEEDDEKGKLWIWIIMGIIVTLLLTACAVTTFFFLREYFWM